jgi:hypothetical protein
MSRVVLRPFWPFCQAMDILSANPVLFLSAAVMGFAVNTLAYTTIKVS